MPDTDDQLKFLSACVYFQAQMTAAQQMFGKGFFALAPSEFTAVQNAVQSNVSSLMQLLTPETLKQLAGQPVRGAAGFQPPSGGTATPPPAQPTGKEPNR